MDCPFLRYEDTGWFTWRYWCTVTGQQVGDENHTTRVDCTCKKGYENCPIYRREKVCKTNLRYWKEKQQSKKQKRKSTDGFPLLFLDIALQPF